MKISAWIALILSFTSCACYPYETETHALMTDQAYSVSVLAATGSTSTIHSLGLDRLDVLTPFSIYWGAPPPIAGPDEYLDNITGQLYPPAGFEHCNMQEFLLGKIPAVDPRFVLFRATVDLPGENMKLPIQNWLVRGAVREDDLGVATALNYISANCNPLSTAPSTGSTLRVLNHFYDPINNLGLNGGVKACPSAFGPCQKSVDWAQGVVDSFPTPPVLPQIDTSRRNHFTYEDARQAMWLALTQEFPATSTPSPTDGDRYNAAAYRLYQWATTFRDLGDVVHLLQDTGQPQHTRNDPHSFLQSPEQQALEGFTNARVLGQTVGTSGSYVRSFFGENLSTVIPPPPLGNYPAVTFATPLRFFTTRAYNDTPSTSPDNRYGLADYTNRGFFTGGTLPGASTDPYAEPPQTLDSAHGYTAANFSCYLPSPVIFPPAQAVSCTHYTRAVSDTVDPSYSSQDVLPVGFTQPPLAAVGVFAQPILSFAPGVNYVSETATGIEELVNIANLTIPRAVGYSAGMINYFFRGTIDVEPINYGALAVLNQGAPHSMNQYGYPCVGSTPSDGCAIFGFTTLRLKIHNTTPNITESGTGTVVPQTMIATTAGTPNFSNPNSGNAYLVAVARYHRNACYTPSLAGLPVTTYAGTTTNPPTTCTAGSVRTPYQEISVSQSIAVPAATLNAASASAVAFDFSNDPIPVNATDLFVQVVYRGPLGQEQDGIAVGTLDVSEPTFAAFWNNTDYFVNDSDQWIHDTSAPYILSTVNSLIVCAGGQKAYSFTGTPGNEISYPTPPSAPDNPGAVRLAVLVSPTNMVSHRVSLSARSFTSSQQLPDYVFATLADVRQANVENLPAADLAAPASSCATTDPTQPACWRFDSVAQRRGLVWASAGDWWPLHIQTANAQNTPDVDSVPLPVFTATTFIQGGTVDFNSATLTACPF
ncbi:MAG: hypothetical protein DYH18_05885 [Xanthomonadales bacterium PRO7]|nr:hypothetical protein [Xanthomonadales bacterium PRO7]